jgi:gamma-glutamyl hydrolase
MKYSASAIFAGSALLMTSNAAASSPVVAIMSHPYNSTHEFIASSYIKWLELGGARTVRVPFDASHETIDITIANTNGLLFMGGAPSLPESAIYYYSQALQADATYPMWGTCLGFEWLSQLGANDTSVLTSGFDAENITLAIEPTEYAADSRMYSSNNVLDLASNYPITMNNHGAGVTPDDFNSFEGLDNFNILSTNVDRGGKKFVSSFEHKTLPIYAVQYHPEKNTFEYGSLNDETDTPYECIDHSPEGTRYSFELASFFVDQTRQSGTRYDVKSGLRTVVQENDGILIGASFEERYLFKV